MKQFDWEPLSEPWEAEISDASALTSDYKQIVLQRDENWDIVGNVSGKMRVDAFRAFGIQEMQRGQKMEPIKSIPATSHYGEVAISLNYVFETQTQLVFGSKPSTAVLQISTVTFDFPKRKPAERLICCIWCLNSPANDLHFPRQTIREYRQIYKRSRPMIGELVSDWPQPAYAADCCLLPAPSFIKRSQQAVFSKAPKDAASEEWRPCAVEFPLDEITQRPTMDDLHDYAEELSFTFGRMIIPIGYTLIDQSLQPHHHFLRRARGDDTARYCSQGTMPPTTLSEGESAFVNEERVTKLMLGFRQHRTRFAFEQALWRIHTGTITNMENTAPIYGSALEGIIDAWYAESATPKQKQYMADSEWTSLTTDAREALAKTLTSSPHKDRLLDKFAKLNQFGKTEGFNRFFEYLSLKIGKIERNAIGSRHHFAHGGTITEGNTDQTVKNTWGYRSLLNRVMLRLIGWTDTYTDYSREGFPEIGLEKPMGTT